MYFFLYFMLWYTYIRTEFRSLTSGYPSVTHLQIQFYYGVICMILGCRLYILLHTLSDSYGFYCCILWFWILKVIQIYFCICKLWPQKCYHRFRFQHFDAHCMMFTKLCIGTFTAIDFCGAHTLQCIY